MPTLKALKPRFNYRNSLGYSARLGATVSNTRYKDETGWNDAQLQNSYMFNGMFAKEWRESGWKADVSGSLYGPQELPDGRARDESPWYSLVHMSVSKQVSFMRVGVRVENVFDYTQPDDPYLVNVETGERNLDAAMIYGPLLGRVFQLQLSAVFGSK